MTTSILKPRLLTVATSFLLSVCSACTTDSDQPGGSTAGSAAKSGSGGSAGKRSDAGETAYADGGAGEGGKGGSGGRNNAGRGGSGGRGGSSGGAGSSGNGSDSSAELFDPERLPRFDITLPEASISALNANSDVYTHASLTYGDTTLEDVAIRIKGESSKRKLTQKAAFKLKFDEYVADQTLLGLKRLTLNNMLSDATFMAECLSYYVYRAADLPAPRCNHALVYVNDTFYGVYANVESEDKTFLKRHFSNNDGNLYEDAQVDFNSGNEALFDLQTNETANNRSDLTALMSAIDSAQSSSYLADLDSVLDTAHFLRFSAVEAAVNQWDGYSYTYFEPNNFRIYHDPSTSKFTFLPWGHDLAMKAFPTEAGPTTAFIPLFKAPVYENQAGQRDAGGRIFVGDRDGDQRAQGGCLGSTSCKNQYVTVLREVIGIYEDADLPTLAAEMYARIKTHVQADDRKEVTNEQFEAAYQELRQHLAMRTQVMKDDMTAAGFTP